MITTNTPTPTAIRAILVAAMENSSVYQRDAEFLEMVRTAAESRGGSEGSDDDRATTSSSSSSSSWRRDTFASWFARAAKIALTSPQQATLSAQRGLEKMHGLFFYTRGNLTVTLDEACERAMEPSRLFHKVVTIDRGVAHHHPHRTTTFLEDVRELYSRGQCEASVVRSFEALAAHPEWLDLTGRVAVVLGALAPLAPTRELLRLGATVYAIDTSSSSPSAWDELIAFAETNPRGTLKLPFRAGHYDADLIADMPEIARFICDQVDSKQPIIFNLASESALRRGCDAETVMFSAAAADAITEFVCFHKPDAILAFFSSPGEMYLIPEEAVRAVTGGEPGDNLYGVETRLAAARVECVNELALNAANAPMGSAVRARRFGRNDDGVRSFFLRDCIARREGPELALARLVGRWRAVLARVLGTHKWLCDSRRHVVSSNLAPPVLPLSTTTTIDLSSLRGVMPMTPETAAALLTHLAVRDLKDVDSPANPTYVLDNPMCHFLQGGLHGGVWRSPASYDEIHRVMMTMTASL